MKVSRAAAAPRERAVACKVPAYPSHLHARGPVVVRVLVDEAGLVRDARAVRGHALLRAGAVRAAGGWRFRPLRRGGKAVRAEGLLALTFSYFAGEMERQCGGLRRAP